MVNITPSNIKIRARAVSMVSDILQIGTENAEAVLEKHNWNIKEAINSWDA